MFAVGGRVDRRQTNRGGPEPQSRKPDGAGRGREVDGRPAESSSMEKRNNFLEQIRKAQEAAKAKPEPEAPKPANEMSEAGPRRRGEPDSELRTGGVGSCVLRFFGFPDFVTGP